MSSGGLKEQRRTERAILRPDQTNGHEVDFILEKAGKLVALEIKAGTQVTTGDLVGIRAFRNALKRKGSLVWGVVLHSGKARPLDADDVALPWGWMVPKIAMSGGFGVS